MDLRILRRVFAFAEFKHHQLCNSIPSPCGLHSKVEEYHLFLIEVQGMTIFLVIFLHKSKRGTLAYFKKKPHDMF